MIQKRLILLLILPVKVNNEKVMEVNGNVREMAVSPDGKEVAFIVRGEVFVSSADGGVTKRITNTPGRGTIPRLFPIGRYTYLCQRTGKQLENLSDKDRKD